MNAGTFRKSSGCIIGILMGLGLVEVVNFGVTEVELFGAFSKGFKLNEHEFG